MVEAAWKAGIRLFGENRVQEAGSKFRGFFEERASAKLHLIGSLQRNKAKAALALFDCIQSLDRDSLIDTLGDNPRDLTNTHENPLMVLLEYKTGEETKAGFSSLDDLIKAAEKVMRYPGLKLSGLMTMAPFSSDKTIQREAFRKLACAKDELSKRFPAEDWSCISMGMSGDFETAIEEGSTMIRLGTALFGERCV